MTAADKAASVVWAAFQEMTPASRRQLGTALCQDGDPDGPVGFLHCLGVALTANWPRYLPHAVATAVRSGEAADLVRTLGAEEPWCHVAAALAYAVEQGVEDHDPLPHRAEMRRVLRLGDPGYEEAWADG